MAEKQMIYDFETVLTTLIKSQKDMIEMVSKWSSMLSTTPQYLEFNLSGRDQPLVVPNIQMVINTLNERSIPDDLHVKSVRTTAAGGGGEFTAGHVRFAGSGTRATYGNYGIEGKAWHVQTGIPATEPLMQWPLPRYWVHSGQGANAELDVNLGIGPSIERGPEYSVSEFYVYIGDASKTMNIYGIHPSGRQYAKLSLTTDGRTGPVVWHVIAVVKAPERGNPYLTLHANIMD